MSNAVIPNHETHRSSRRGYFFLTFYELLMIVCTAAVPIVICIYTALDNKQKLTEADRRRQFELKQSQTQRQQDIYDKFIEDFYKLDRDGQLNDSAKPWAFANARYWSANRQWSPPLKVDALVFFKQRGLIGRRCRQKDSQTQILEDVIKLNGLNFDHVEFKSPTNGLVPLDMACVNFDQVSLSGSVFGSTNLNEATFEGSRLTDTSFQGSSLAGAVFNGTDLSGVNFGDSNLQNALFQNVDLTTTILSKEQIASVNFTNTKPSISGENAITTGISDVSTMINASKAPPTNQILFTEKQTAAPLTTETIIEGGIQVSGPIHKNTIWTKAKSPFYVTGDVQVADGITLTIQAGVRIIYDTMGDFELLVRGYLHVEGTSADPVTFDGPTMINANKSMITFKATNLSQSSIVHARFIGSRKSVELAEIVADTPLNTGLLFLRNCLFQATEIKTHSSSPFVRNPTNFEMFSRLAIFDSKFARIIPRLIISNSTLTDSIISNGDQAPQLIEIHSCHLQNITINALARFNGIRLSTCRGENVQIFWSGTAQSYFTIDETTLKNLWIKHQMHSVGSKDYAPFTIRRSNLENATILAARSYLSSPITNLSILSSKISVSRAIEIDEGSIHCSTITSFTNSSMLIGIIARSVSIIDSSINGFYIGLRVEEYDKPMNVIKNSNFYGNTLYNIQNLGHWQVNASGNWWGTITNIQLTLYDYQNNINYGQVLIDNYSQHRIPHQC